MPKREAAKRSRWMRPWRAPRMRKGSLWPAWREGKRRVWMAASTACWRALLTCWTLVAAEEEEEEEDDDEEEAGGEVMVTERLLWSRMKEAGQGILLRVSGWM
jgi:hypothetical protein